MAAYSLSDEQRKIVDYRLQNDGPMLVEASAGSGKTRVLTECVRQIVGQNPRETAKILCLTFTNKAAEEMSDRLKDVDKITERAFIGTIHSFALDILQTKRHEIGYDEMPHILDHHSDQIAILRDVFLKNRELAEFFESEKDERRFLESNLSFISERKRNLVVIEEGTTQHRDFAPNQLVLFKEYNHHLRNQSLIDFDDVLLLAWRILIERPATADLYRRLFKYVLIDEAQDLSRAQYQLIRALCGNQIRNILMVGDANQAIHGYAGADQEIMKRTFPEDFGLADEAHMHIERNYRSSAEVIDCANRIAGRKIDSESAYYKGEVRFYAFVDEVAESEWVISKIKDYVNTESDEFDGLVTLDKIAILARNKFVFSPLKKLLDEDDVLASSYSMRKGAESLSPQSTFMGIFDLGTRVLANPYGEVYISQLATLLGASNTRLVEVDGLAILGNIGEAISSDSLITQDDFQILHACWTKIDKKIDSMDSCLTNLRDHVPNLLVEEEREYASLDIAEWTETWGKYIRSVAPESKSLGDFRRHASLGLSSATKQNGLTLATVHTAKGLEFPIVFLIGMEQGTFPDYRSTNGKAFEEERNNAYVAVTRAKRRLYVSYAKNKMMPWGSTKMQYPSAFLNGFGIIAVENSDE